MWIQGIDGSWGRITTPSQLHRHWFNEHAVGERYPRPTLPYKVFIHVDQASVEADSYNMIQIVLSEWDTEEAMNRAFEDLRQKINSHFYLPAGSPLPVNTASEIMISGYENEKPTTGS